MPVPDAITAMSVSPADTASPEAVPGGFMAADLSAHIKGRYDAAKRARSETGVDNRLIECLRQYESKYSPDVLELIRKAGGTDVFRGVTAMKAADCTSWIAEIMTEGTERIWALDPTPIPDLPEDQVKRIADETEQMARKYYAVKAAQLEDADAQGMLTQEMVDEFNDDMAGFSYEFAKVRKVEVEKEIADLATDSALAMQKLMDDQQVEGNFRGAMSAFLIDYAIYPNAFFKGPVFRRKKTIGWGKDEQGKTKAVIEYKPSMMWERVSPFDMYFSPGASDIKTASIFERKSFSRKELNAMSGVPGYSKEAIQRVFEQNETDGISIPETDTERRVLENKPSSSANDDESFEGFFFWGGVKGELLKKWEIEVEDENEEYEISALIVGSECVKAIINEDLLGEKPYYTASFKEVPGSLWGKSLPESMQDIQKECNYVTRELCNNLGLSSGPMIAYDMDKVAHEDITMMFPRKILQYSGKAGNAYGNAPPVQAITIPCNAGELLECYKHFKGEAADVTNIPDFYHGNSAVGGAGNTASGLAMLQGNAAKGIKYAVSRISQNVIEPSLQNQYNYNMQKEDDESIKGDCKISVRGPLAVIAKEQLQVRRNEFLNATNNPTDLEIIGKKGRATLLRESAKTLELKTSDIVPTQEKLDKQDEEAAQAQQSQMIQQQQLQLQAGQPQQQEMTA